MIQDAPLSNRAHPFCSRLIKIYQTVSKSAENTEAKLAKEDIKWLAGATLAGGVIAPIILLYSLDTTPAATASLLLNFESVATTLIATILFKETMSRRAWWAILIITSASVLLSINLNTSWGFSLGAVGIVAACLFWGIDNNLTRNISAKDPIMIVTVKGFVAGIFSLILALLLGQTIPGWKIILKALALGSLSYGASITLFIIALRGLGAARTSALFSTSPLSCLALSLILFKELPGFLFFAAIPLMILGTYLLVNEKHAHKHAHEFLSHDHSHKHNDEHHEHDHENGLSIISSHTHPHDHLPNELSHHHMPDIHHRHEHKKQE